MVNFRVLIVCCNFFCVTGIVVYGCVLYAIGIASGLLTAYFLVSFLAMVSYCRTALVSPGFVKKESEGYNAERLESGKRFCFLCNCVKDENVYHCKVCKRCVANRSHHCKWVGNCIGKNNRKFFILFLGYFCLWAAASTGICGWVIYKICEGFAGLEHIVVVCFLAYGCVGGLVFLFFCTLVLINQIRKVKSNRALVYVVRKNSEEAETFCINFKKIFGNFSCFWFLPVSVSVSNEILDNNNRDEQRNNVNTTTMSIN